MEAARRLKADPRTREIPIVALSGRVALQDGVGDPQAGFSAVVTKPFAPEALLSAVRAALRRS